MTVTWVSSLPKGVRERRFTPDTQANITALYEAQCLLCTITFEALIIVNGSVCKVSKKENFSRSRSMLAYFAQKLQKFVKKWVRKTTFRAEKLFWSFEKCTPGVFTVHRVYMMEKCGCLPFYRLSLKDLEGLYPGSKVFSLAWLLALTKSFSWLVSRIK